MKSLLILTTLLTSTLAAEVLEVTGKKNSVGDYVVTARNLPPNCTAVSFCVRFQNGRISTLTIERGAQEAETFAVFHYEPSLTRPVEAKATTMTSNGGSTEYAKEIN